MKTKVLSLIGIMFLLLSFISCASTKGFEGKADIHGLVIDENNNGVDGYRISLNGSFAGVTDHNGYFVLKDIEAGTYSITGEKQGFGNINVSKVIDLKTSLLCIQTISFNKILEEAEYYISNDDVEKCKEYVDSVSSKDKARDEVLFLKSMIASKEKNKWKSIRCLHHMKLYSQNKEIFKDYESKISN